MLKEQDFPKECLSLTLWAQRTGAGSRGFIGLTGQECQLQSLRPYAFLKTQVSTLFPLK